MSTEGNIMLVEFRVSNFRSFRDEQVFSMVASADKTHPENTITPRARAKQRLLRSAVLYGANASGKSNFVQALSALQNLVGGSVTPRASGARQIKPFLLDRTARGAPSRFEITFVYQDVRYQYGLTLDQEHILDEWLIAYPKGAPQTWYERRPSPDTGESTWYFGPRLTGERNRLAALTRPDALFLTVAATFNHRQLSLPFNWLNDHLRVVDANRVDDGLHWATVDLVQNHPETRRTVEHLLRHADLGILDFSCEERPGEEQELPADLPEELRASTLRSPQLEIKMFHESDDPEGHRIAVAWDDESLGTQRYFALGGLLAHTLADGFVLVVDELDASMHPILVQTLIRMFHDPSINRNNAQLVFNTHDTTLLDASIFRRDQIWFVEKHRSGASHLYPLLDFSPRKDEALGKGYLEGRYGGIPFVEDLLSQELVHAEG